MKSINVSLNDFEYKLLIRVLKVFAEEHKEDSACKSGNFSLLWSAIVECSTEKRV